MKKYCLLILLVFSVVSCRQTEVNTNISAQEKVNSTLPTPEITDNQKYQDIKEVDFKNFTYKKVESKDSEYTVRCLFKDFSLKNGRFDKDGEHFWLNQVFFGDLNNDGKNEAIIWVSCNYGEPSGNNEAFIYSLKDDKPQFTYLIQGGKPQDGAIIGIKILPKGILEVETIGSTTAERSNVNQKFIDTYEFKNNKLIQIGKTKTEKYQPK